jgi:hypothetical protein
LPDEIQKRGKMGFGIPLPTRFCRDSHPLVEKRQLEPSARFYEWIRLEAASSMAEPHFAATADDGHRLSALFTLETWLAHRRAA